MLLQVRLLRQYSLTRIPSPRNQAFDRTGYDHSLGFKAFGFMETHNPDAATVGSPWWIGDTHTFLSLVKDFSRVHEFVEIALAEFAKRAQTFFIRPTPSIEKFPA